MYISQAYIKGAMIKNYILYIHDQLSLFKWPLECLCCTHKSNCYYMTLYIRVCVYSRKL